MQHPHVAVEGPVSLRVLADAALLASVQSAHFIEREPPVPEEAVVRYWQHSRNLQQRWLQRLDACRSLVKTPRPETDVTVAGLLAELFVAEMLTRVWTGLLFAADRRWHRTLHEPLARNVLIGQLQVRRRGLALMLACPSTLLEVVVSADRLRRRCERWTDLLLGHLIERYDLAELAFDPEQARDFGEERQHGDHNLTAPVHLLMQAGLQLAFSQHLPPHCRPEAESAPLLRAILACLPSVAFNADGTLKSSRHARLERSSVLPESPLPKNGSRLRQTPANMIPPPTASLSFAELRRRLRRGE